MSGLILIGVDGRPGGREALRLARRLAGEEGVLLAVHVDDATPLPMRGVRPDFERPLRAEAERLLADELEATGVAAETRVVFARSVARGLLHAAARARAQLIVVGSAHRGRVGRAVAGDDVRAVLREASCPVAVARPAPWPPQRAVVGVGFDGSMAARAALRRAAALAGELDAAVHVVCAVEPTSAFSPSTLQGLNWNSPPILREEQARALIDEAVDELGAGATGEVVIGHAAAALAELSQRVSLLVIGSRRPSAIGRAVLGSVSDALVHGASCPVVVVPAAGVRERPAARLT